MDAACPPDALVRDDLARLCLLALAVDRRDVRMLDAGSAGSLERLAEVMAEGSP